jgi:hypothetical protein
MVRKEYIGITEHSKFLSTLIFIQKNKKQKKILLYMITVEKLKAISKGLFKARHIKCQLDKHKNCLNTIHIKLANKYIFNVLNI